MPTPLAHAVAGLAVAATIGHRRRVKIGAVLLVSGVAILPDLDFVAGLAVGAPHRFHRGPTHSLLGAVVLAGIVVPVLARIGGFREPANSRSSTDPAGSLRRNPASAGRSFRNLTFVWWTAFGVLLSHLIADAIMPDPGGGVGVPFLWPFTARDYSAVLPLPLWLADALEIRFDGSTSWFLATLFSARTALVSLAEGLLFTPLLIVPWVIRRLNRF